MMSFTSATFLILFMPLCILPAYCMQERARNIFLCICSIIFYAWCGVKFLLLALILGVFAWVIGLLLQKTERVSERRAMLILAIAVNVGTLFFYKYLFNLIPGAAGFLGGLLHLSEDYAGPAYPLGISFYILSSLSYVIDVYWENCRAEGNVLNVWFYLLFFPKVVQGPIMRYTEFRAQMERRVVDTAALNEGLERFIKGMFKKVMIADQIEPLVTYAFSDVSNIGTITAWVGILTYLLQLYYDFSGYSDMAVGLGRMLGFMLPENFDHPYLSNSVTEYWRRWHISLGAWLRDYIYTPLYKTLISVPWLRRNGKRGLLICNLLALLVTWVAAGVWHGSGVKYFLYGIWWFLFIAFEKLRDDHRKALRRSKKLPKQLTKGQRSADRILTVVAVVFGQVIFRSETLVFALRYWKRMLVWNAKDGILFLHQLDNYMVFALAVGIIFIFPVYGKIKKKLCDGHGSVQVMWRVGLLLAAFVVFCYAISDGYSAFLYEVF